MENYFSNCKDSSFVGIPFQDKPLEESRGVSASTIPSISRLGSDYPPGSQYGSRTESATFAKSELASRKASAISTKSEIASRTGSAISAKSELASRKGSAISAVSRVASAGSAGSRVSSAGSVFYPSAEGSKKGRAMKSF